MDFSIRFGTIYKELEKKMIGFREAIFDENGKQLTNWWKSIFCYSLINEKSFYYIAERGDEKRAVFHINNPDNPISNWHKFIYADGLVLGESEYYIAVRENNEIAIFHVSNPNNPISQWFKWHEYFLKGLVKNESEYYLVKNKDNKFAIFHKDNSDDSVTEWEKEVTDDFLELLESKSEVELNVDF